MQIDSGLPKLYQKIYEDDQLRVIKHRSGEDFIVYDYTRIPDPALNSDGTYNRYGARFFSQSLAQNNFFKQKQTTEIIRLKTNQII